jgi:hypothetical protein
MRSTSDFGIVRGSAIRLSLSPGQFPYAWRTDPAAASDDLLSEYQLAAMKQHLGATTMLLPVQPELTAMSSTLVRGLGSDLLAKGWT